MDLERNGKTEKIRRKRKRGEKPMGWARVKVAQVLGPALCAAHRREGLQWAEPTAVHYEGKKKELRTLGR